MLAKLDLDKVLATAKGDDPHGYLREAAANYRSDSNRSCIVSVYNAVFLNIYTKLEHLVEVNRKDEQIFNRARRLKNEKEPYEHNLAEELKKAELITSEQQKYLEQLRLQRNDAAHPIGGDWPATKAAYFLTEAVRLFLSQESLSPSMVIAEIFGRLTGDNCFPSSTRSAQLAIVAMEIGRLIPAAYHLFVKELRKSWNTDDLTLKRNIGIFVRESLTLKNSGLERAILKQFVEPLLNHLDPDDVRFIISMIALSPSWMRNLNSVSQERIARLIVDYVASEPEYFGARLFLRIHGTSPSLFDGALKTTLRPILARNAMDPKLIATLMRQGAAREELLIQYRLQALGRGRTKMLEFLGEHRAYITEKLSEFESYALLLATSGGEGRADVAPNGISAMLLAKAEQWFERDRDSAIREARRAGVYDPALWLGEVVSSLGDEPIISAAG